uniref:Uncharacterized protein n=1 Tax=Rhipicephalus zambeziensis TaxID=60191 RepID=A0A224Y5F7_9ACAR
MKIEVALKAAPAFFFKRLFSFLTNVSRAIIYLYTNAPSAHYKKSHKYTHAMYSPQCSTKSERVLSEVPQSMKKKKIIIIIIKRNNKVKGCDGRRRGRRVRAASRRLSLQSPKRHKIPCVSTQHRLTTLRPPHSKT